MHDNVSCTYDLHNIYGVLLVKLDNIENMLNKSTPTISGKDLLTPTNNSQVIQHYGPACAEKDISNMVLMMKRMSKTNQDEHVNLMGKLPPPPPPPCNTPL
uniref:Uncharacterized protein n=1 Tax=Medicago truncatula TaxID=3880 RepID=A2Q349_MEDTR|nr:hypothetical protein MtrDRAFT_AC154867g7v2 [Medicago truncatula]